jgi:hypothetical protein
VCNVKFLIILCFYKYAYIKIQYLRIVINSMGIISKHKSRTFLNDAPYPSLETDANQNKMRF